MVYLSTPEKDRRATDDAWTKLEPGTLCQISWMDDQREMTYALAATPIDATTWNFFVLMPEHRRDIAHGKVAPPVPIRRDEISYIWIAT
ncbi:hypothetical protein HY632_03215 [Candidatus Uhrbacteria bacterium]|nr:hypothetical protein [Candidatus Uhrbacteria bacterium]